MGLTISIKGYDGAYDCGYITHNVFMRSLAEVYNEEFGKLYDKWCDSALIESRKLTDEEIKRWNEICNDDLDILLLHSDCDGKLTPKECRKVYEVIKNFEINMPGHNYGDMKPYNLLEKWKDMLRYCYIHRVNMYFI